MLGKTEQARPERRKYLETKTQPFPTKHDVSAYTGDMFTLVPERICGDCKVCCDVLIVDAPEMVKPPGVLCKHWCAGGCSIYDKRPGTCRGFFCVWRLFALPDEWRPDRSQVLLYVGADASDDKLRETVRVHLFGAYDRILWPPLVGYIGHMITNDIGVYLSVAANPGDVVGCVSLTDNQKLRQAYAAKDIPAVAAALVECVQFLVEHPKEKLVFENAPPEAAAEMAG